jgi:DnaJ-class molecular chaperone
MAHSYFEILGISEDATTDDVKSAYRRLAHQHHPDHLEGDSRNFRALQEAYDALIDPEQRRRYKAQGSGESIPVRIVRGSSGRSRSAPRGEPLRPTGGYGEYVSPVWQKRFRRQDFDDVHSRFEELFSRILRSFYF